MTSGSPTLPLVSICINNYNYGRFVGAAIESCLTQTYGRVEIIVVDDGSIDNSREVLASFGDRIRLLLQGNHGQSAAVNFGVQEASGDIILLLDADDVLLADTVARAVEAFSRDDSLVRLQWQLELMTESGVPSGRVIPSDGWSLPTGDLARHAVQYRTYVWNPTSASAYRMRVLREVLPVPEGTYARSTGPDLYLSETVVLFGSVGVLDGVGGYYRIHGVNASTVQRDDEVAWLRVKVDEILAGHEHVKSLAGRTGRSDCPQDVRQARDWAFAAYRLALLRLDATRYPLRGDSVLSVARHGVVSSLTHPHLTTSQRLKRACWFVLMALAPIARVPELNRRMFHASPERRFAAEQKSMA